MGSTTSKSSCGSSSTNQVFNHQPKKTDTEFNQSNMNPSKSKAKQDRNKNVKRTNSRHGCEFFQSCFMPTSPEPRDNDSNYDSSSDNSDTSSIREMGPNGDNNGNMFYPRNIEQNVRFSRTLSVGRLRDRVVNRPTFHELSEREVVSDENVMISTSSSYGNRDFEGENMGGRETRYTNLLEHRANVLERRRRIRSQVHALQRMGNRFENLSGHERSCILSGQHRTGQCTCRLNNIQDPTNTRGSMSRIVLLTEALFEVLGDTRQQSVVSSSRSTLSSIGSVPTPNEVVEELPVKVYRKLSKYLNEEDAQCYICLVEYEDGDEVRVLPCLHEFHRLCIDKWLKEIHRICPLCRGDVCKNGLLHDESSQL